MMYPSGSIRHERPTPRIVGGIQKLSDLAIDVALAHF